MSNALAYSDAVTLLGNTVRLEPLREDHAGDLFTASRSKEIWDYLPTEWPRTLDEMRLLLGEALTLREQGLRVPFAVVDLESRRAIGSTSYLLISEPNRNLEIGWTWYATQYQRTAVNTECKYLLLRRAFEDLGCIRVQLQTDERNTRSRAAIERIGGVLEGIRRKDRIVKGGYVRSSAVYSLLANEWPERKAWFEERLMDSN